MVRRTVPSEECFGGGRHFIRQVLKKKIPGVYLSGTVFWAGPISTQPHFGGNFSAVTGNASYGVGFPASTGTAHRARKCHRGKITDGNSCAEQQYCQEKSRILPMEISAERSWTMVLRHLFLVFFWPPSVKPRTFLPHKFCLLGSMCGTRLIQPKARLIVLSPVVGASAGGVTHTSVFDAPLCAVRHDLVIDSA